MTTGVKIHFIGIILGSCLIVPGVIGTDATSIGEILSSDLKQIEFGYSM